MDQTPAGLVRKYTWEVEKRLSPEVPQHDARRILIDGEKYRTENEYKKLYWGKYYEPWDPVLSSDFTTKALDAKSVELSHAWNNFRKTLPENERDEVEGTIPSIDTLVEMIEQRIKVVQNTKSKSKRGKFMKYFIGFCGTLDAHSSMLEALPNDRYLCLFTGTLKTIINASSNYENIAKGIGEALSRISVNVVACQKEVDLYKTKELQTMIANLYAHIFLYLQDTMNWYLKKPRNRFLDSFNENFNDHFEDLLVSIENISKGILREVNLSSKAEIRQTKSTTDFLAASQANTRVSFDNIERKVEDTKHSTEQLRRELEHYYKEHHKLSHETSERLEMMAAFFSDAYSGLRSELLAVVERTASNQRRVGGAPATRSLAFIEGQSNMFAEVQSYQRDKILLESNYLLDMFDVHRIQAPCDSSTPLTIDTSASSRLVDWISAKNSNLLSIAGHQQNGLELAPMTVLSSHCIHFAIKSELPVISYFCELSREEVLRGDNTREAQELIGLIYALIRQLIEYLPPAFESEHDFSTQKLSLLDGTLKSWNVAIGLLRELLQLAPKTLFCIIDGFQVLDDRSTEKYLVGLVEMLRGQSQSGPGTSKVLFTTTGRSRALLGVLSHSELILADRDGAKDGPARRAGYSRFALG